MRQGRADITEGRCKGQTVGRASKGIGGLAPALQFETDHIAAARAQQIPEEHMKIIEQQKRNAPSLEDDDWLKPKPK